MKYEYDPDLDRIAESEKTSPYSYRFLAVLTDAYTPIEQRQNVLRQLTRDLVNDYYSVFNGFSPKFRGGRTIDKDTQIIVNWGRINISPEFLQCLTRLISFIDNERAWPEKHLMDSALNFIVEHEFLTMTEAAFEKAELDSHNAPMIH